MYSAFKFYIYLLPFTFFKMYKKNWYLTNNHILFLLQVIIMYY